jgi:hypothetical protein
MLLFPTIARPRIRRSYYAIVIGLLSLLMLLTACGEEPVRGDEELLQGAVVLECSRDCQDHGSCGRTEESNQKVLLLGAEPAFPHVSNVEFKGLVDGTPVEVQDTQIIKGIVENTGEDVEIRFYQVYQPLADMTGWIPGFCLVKANE